MKRELRNMVELKEFLKNPSPNLKVPVYTENEDEAKTVKKPRQERMTLTKLATTVNDLAKEMRDGFKQVNARIDNLEKDIDARLDYIVKANDLKDLPKSNK